MYPFDASSVVVVCYIPIGAFSTLGPIHFIQGVRVPSRVRDRMRARAGDVANSAIHFKTATICIVVAVGSALLEASVTPKDLVPPVACPVVVHSVLFRQKSVAVALSIGNHRHCGHGSNQ